MALSDGYDNAPIPYSVKVYDNAGNYTEKNNGNSPFVTFYGSILNDDDASIDDNVTLSYSAPHVHGSEYYAASGDTYSLNINSLRNLDSVTYTFDGSSNTLSDITSGTTSISDSKTGSTESTIVLSTITITDEAGNEWTRTSLPQGGALYYDGKAPAAVSLTLNGDGGDAIVNGTEIGGSTIDWTSLETNYAGYRDSRDAYANLHTGSSIAVSGFSEGSQEIHLQVEDKVGHLSPTSDLSFFVDTIKPEATSTGDETSKKLTIVFANPHLITDFAHFTIKQGGSNVSISSADWASDSSTLELTATDTFSGLYTFSLVDSTGPVVDRDQTDVAGNVCDEYGITYNSVLPFDCETVAQGLNTSNLLSLDRVTSSG